MTKFLYVLAALMLFSVGEAVFTGRSTAAIIVPGVFVVGLIALGLYADGKWSFQN